MHLGWNNIVQLPSFVEWHGEMFTPSIPASSNSQLEIVTRRKFSVIPVKPSFIIAHHRHRGIHCEAAIGSVLKSSPNYQLNYCRIVSHHSTCTKQYTQTHHRWLPSTGYSTFACHWIGRPVSSSHHYRHAKLMRNTNEDSINWTISSHRTHQISFGG